MQQARLKGVSAGAGELPSQNPSKPESFRQNARADPDNLWQMAVAGLCGAVLAWLVDECLFPDHYTYRSFMEMVLGMAWWGCLISGIIGFLRNGRIITTVSMGWRSGKVSAGCSGRRLAGSSG